MEKQTIGDVFLFIACTIITVLFMMVMNIILHN